MLLNKIYDDKYYRLSGLSTLSLQWVYWYIHVPEFDVCGIVYCKIKEYCYGHSRPYGHQHHRKVSHRTTSRPPRTTVSRTTIIMIVFYSISDVISTRNNSRYSRWLFIVRFIIHSRILSFFNRDIVNIIDIDECTRRVCIIVTRLRSSKSRTTRATTLRPWCEPISKATDFSSLFSVPQ